MSSSLTKTCLKVSRLPLRQSKCKICHREFSRSSRIRQDEQQPPAQPGSIPRLSRPIFPQPSTSSSSSSEASEADARKKPTSEYWDSLLKVINNQYTRRDTMRRSAAGGAAGTASQQQSITADYDNTMRNLDRSRLERGLSRSTDRTALFNSSQTIMNRSSKTSNLESRQLSMDLRRRLGRLWVEGDVYTPADLGPREQRKWLKRQPVQIQGDVFERIGRSPMSFYRNFTVLSEFVTETGRIRPAKETGLKRKNQRQIAKTVRRSIALGIIPSIHKHPMMLKGQITGIEV